MSTSSSNFHNIKSVSISGVSGSEGFHWQNIQLHFVGGGSHTMSMFCEHLEDYLRSSEDIEKDKKVFLEQTNTIANLRAELNSIRTAENVVKHINPKTGGYL